MIRKILSRKRNTLVRSLSFKVKSNLLSLILLGLVFSFWALAATQPVFNPDIWYHLKTGEYISQTKTVPRQDFFSSTATGREWIAQWWLYDVVVFQIQSRFGFNGLVALKIINSLAIAVVVFKTMSRFKIPLALSSLLMAGGMLIIANAWVDRPHLFSYFYTVLLTDILIAYRFGSRKNLLMIPILILVWANSHASIPLALVILGFAIVAKFWQNLEANLSVAKAIPIDLVLISAVAAVMSLLNPNGLRTHLYVFKINPEFVAANIVEWIPISGFFDDYHIQLFLVFGVVSLVSFVLTGKNKSRLPNYLRVDTFEILIYLALTYLALSALRFAPVFVLILLPFTAKNLVALSILLRDWSIPKHLFKVKPAWISLVIILSIIPIFEFKLEGSGTGVSFAKLPAQASNFLLSEKPEPELYHPFNWGGFFIWHIYPTYRVFIDGRLDMYVPDIYQDWLDVVRAKENWPEILNKFRVNTVIVPNEAEWFKLGQALENAPDWVLVYWDDQAGIFARHISQNQALIEKYGMKAVLVFDTTRSYREDQAGPASQEYRRLIKSCPDCAAARNKLGVLYLLENHWQLAKKYFREAIRLDGSYGAALYNYAYVLELENRYNDAATLYRNSIKVAPFFPDPYRNLGLILYDRLHFDEEALAMLEKYVRLSSPDAPDRSSIQGTIQNIRSKKGGEI